MPDETPPVPPAPPEPSPATPATEAPKPAAGKGPVGELFDALQAVGDDLLDAAETLLFGRVGGADDAVKLHRDEDPLERLRAEHALRQEEDAARPPAPDPEAAARAELEALKAAKAGAPPPTRKL